MSDALVPVIAGRPPIIVVDGCTVFLSIHDREYFRIKSVLRAAMAAEHPDRPRLDRLGHKARARNTEFRAALARWQSFQAAQRVIYWALDQMPPDWTGPPTAPPGRRPRRGTQAQLCGRWRPFGKALHA